MSCRSHHLRLALLSVAGLLGLPLTACSDDDGPGGIGHGGGWCCSLLGRVPAAGEAEVLAPLLDQLYGIE